MSKLVPYLIVGECWEADCSSDRDGYGQLWRDGKHYKAHRLQWEVCFGPIPRGMFVCHSCDNPICVRPAHLFLGTPKDNTRDMLNKGRGRNQNTGKEVCVRGHNLLDKANVRLNNKGGRICLPCRRIRDNRRNRVKAQESASA